MCKGLETLIAGTYTGVKLETVVTIVRGRSFDFTFGHTTYSPCERELQDCIANATCIKGVLLRSYTCSTQGVRGHVQGIGVVHFWINQSGYVKAQTVAQKDEPWQTCVAHGVIAIATFCGGSRDWHRNPCSYTSQILVKKRKVR